MPTAAELMALGQYAGGPQPSKAQQLIQRAGYKGLTGNVDGPEWVHYGPVGLE